MYSINPNSKEFGDPLNATFYDIYKTIDQNSNTITIEKDGSVKHFYGMELGSVIFRIEEFVRAIIKSNKAFLISSNRCVTKRLSLAKYFDMVNSHLALYSSEKIYDPHVELFFQTFVIKYNLQNGDFGPNPNTYILKFKMSQGELFNQLVEEISIATNTREFKRKLYARKEAIRRGLKSARKYIEALFARNSRLLVLRVDFGFRNTDLIVPHTVGLQEAQTHLSRFLNNKRGKTLFANLKGYIWRLEHGREKGHHFHFFFFFDGSKVHKDEYLAHEIGKDWIKVTDGKGIYHNCNANKQKYKRLGIGMISHDDTEKRRILLEVVEYMYKEDQKLREKYAAKTHSWGRGAMADTRSSGLGRPRRVKPSNSLHDEMRQKLLRNVYHVSTDGNRVDHPVQTGG